MLIEAVSIGLFVGIIYYSIVGLVPGGLIVPGYIALHMDYPLRIVATLVSSLVTFLLVRYIVSNYVIIYGKRRFVAMILVGFVVKWLSDQALIYMSAAGTVSAAVDVRVIGYVITGLVANSFAEQGVLPTLYSVLTVSVVVRLILILLFY